MQNDEAARPGYERPAIVERVTIGDPLIVGLYASPHWRSGAESEAHE
jgi:hypothetical protein